VAETRPTVFVVDDDASVRESVARFLARSGYRTETFPSAEAFLRRAPGAGPSCLVLDVNLPELDGLALQQALARAGDPVPIVFITGQASVPMSVRAMKGGAVDFLPKPFDPDALVDAVAHALARSLRERAQRAEVIELQRGLSQLTPREREVLRHVVAGKRNKQIAAELGTTEKTIKVHRAQVMKKMSAGSLAELVRMIQTAHVVHVEAPGL
jgi:RNA polymerase sigma factor (sigma-70 family)